MKKILFLTAFSDHSKEIYRYALRIAHQFGASLTLCHIHNIGTTEENSERELTE